MTKGERHKIILKIIKEQEVETQKELVAALSRAGIKTTQGNLSRDIKALGLQKTRTSKGKSIYTESSIAPTGESLLILKRMLDSFGRGVSRTDNLVVVRTSPGNAPGVAVAIDQAGLSDVLGTVAGDDTILIIAKNKKAGEFIENKLGGS